MGRWPFREPIDERMPDDPIRMIDLSIVIPVRNEAASLETLTRS